MQEFSLDLAWLVDEEWLNDYVGAFGLKDRTLRQL